MLGLDIHAGARTIDIVFIIRNELAKAFDAPNFFDCRFAHVVSFEGALKRTLDCFVEALPPFGLGEGPCVEQCDKFADTKAAPTVPAS